MNLSDEVKVSSALDYASGTADREGGILDMQGFDGVLMVVKFAAIAGSAVTSIKAQQGDLANGNDMADLKDTAITVEDDDDNQIFMIDLYRPEQRYVRLVVDKDTSNATAESAIYLQYGASQRPVVQTVADKVTYEVHAEPVEGTA